MNTTTKLIAGIVIVLLAIAAIAYSGKKGSAPQATGPITIGFIAPLTGDAAAYGEPVQNGMNLAVDEINAAGGIDGRTIKIVAEDGKCTGEAAASAAQKLVSVDKVHYIIGGVCSGESFAIVPVITSAKVLEITPGSSAPKLSGSSPYFMRNNPNDNQPATSLADYLAKTYKKVTIISEKTDYAQGLKAVFIARAQADGLTVNTEDYGTSDTDFRTLLTRIRGTNPDVVFVNSQTSANMLRITKQMHDLGIKTALAGAVFNDKDTIGASSVNGMVLAVPPGLATEGKGATFVANYKSKYAKDPAYAFYAGAAYDDVYLIAQAIQNVGDDATEVRDYLHALPSYTGTVGTYSFDVGGDMIGVSSILQKIVDGKLVTISE